MTSTHPDPSTKSMRIVNCTSLGGATDVFLEGRVDDPPQEWRHHRALPQNWLEKRNHRVARWRACASAAWTARTWDADVVVTHLPLVSAWYELATGVLRPRARHLAFAFTFAELPRPGMQKLMRRAFRKIDRFVAFSRAEGAAYSEVFGIDPARIDFLHWAMSPPDSESVTDLTPSNYVCSVGGEARDYRSVVAAARRLPDTQFVLVTRPHCIAGLEIPDNVHVHTNMTATKFWGVVEGAQAVLLPFRDTKSYAGHISLIGAMQLGTPVVTTRTDGMDDYVLHGENSLVGEPQDDRALAENVERLVQDPDFATQLVDNGRAFVDASCRVERWNEYWRDYLLAGSAEAD